MAAPEVIQGFNSTRKILKKGQLQKDLIQVAENDYLHLLRGIASQETAEQIRLGNKPTNIIVDKRRNKPISQATFSIQVFFVTATDMINALKDGWAMMQRLMARETGLAAKSLEVWQSQNGKNSRAGNHPSSIREAGITRGTGLYIAGPMVPYSRKFQWQSSRGKKFAPSRRSELKGMKAAARPKTTVSIQTQVAKMLRSKYPQLRFVVAWIDVPNLNTSGKTAVSKVPTIGIWQAKKGRI